jgi:hypothetical protein
MREATDAIFAAFLDGVQQSRPLRYEDGVPLVHGRVGAVIRERVARRLTTWTAGRRDDSRLYAPRALLPAAVWATLHDTGLTMVDTLAGAAPGELLHPYELLRRALHAVQHDREALEVELAERWCSERQSPLYVDGGLPSGVKSSVSPHCVGVVKSHHTLYAGDDDLRTVLALPEGFRTSVFVIERQWGPKVASWYLRLRNPDGRAPMWGLVRVEIALGPERHGAISARADDVSTWILAERAPLSLPDGRWDTLAYGVRDCEVYLKAQSAET